MPTVELDCEAGLDELAAQRPLVVADVEVADELLGDRRTALDRPPGSNVVHGRARDALEVDAAVLVVAAILDRHRRLSDPRADLAQRDGLPVPLRRNRAEPRAVGCVDERVGVLEDGLETAEVAAAVDRLRLAEAGASDRGEDRDDE